LDVLAIGAISTGIFALSIIILDWLFRTNSRVGKIHAFKRLFDNYPITLSTYELLVCLLLVTWVVPFLWLETEPSLFSYSYVFVMIVISPPLTYSIIKHRFSKDVSASYPIGMTFEQSVEMHFREGSLEPFMMNFLRRLEDGVPSSVEQEFQEAKRSLLNRQDPVGLAFRKALDEWLSRE
jgi:hypothetical protein